MRLLKRSDDGKLSFTKDLVGDDKVPTYAILSHTWQDGQEVTFDDWTKGNAKSKVGYDKIQFCAQQAERDGLCYFWVDTCCINKADLVELQDAINSMFRWYQGAAKCYVYLSDVSTTKRKASSGNSELTWEPAFRASRWFARGWTLQELLAPHSVEFFSRKGEHLGDKQSLEQQIHEITGIAISALRGASLQGFSIDERLLWTKNRQTTRKEDKAYCLLGVFGIFMPLIYGEGEDHAFRRLRDEIDKATNSLSQQQESRLVSKEDQECVKNLRLTDPRDDKSRIEETKGGLLEDAYRWVLDHNDFREWRDSKHSRLLWIKGDPGKGKTMLLCGIIDELRKSMAKTNLLSYFFCQATDSRINNATAVLRGLLYLLVDQQPSLISHIQKKYNHAGKALFEDANAWTTLSEILTNILRDPNLTNTYLIVDALDECIVGLPKLLDLIVKSSASSRVKWIVSSRNWLDIEERLEMAGHRVQLCLELNEESVSTAVSIFIQHKVRQLVQQKKYSNKTRDTVLSYLSLHANGTFLWVALVCQNLEKIPRWRALTNLSALPPGLDSLYERMIEQICNIEEVNLCKRILASIAIVYRPITLKELIALVELPEDISNDLESLREVVGLCGSFLTIREGTVYFVHQSAKDFLLTKAFNKVFPSGREEIHYEIFSRSLQVMSRTLKRDIYCLGALGYPIDQVEPPNPDPLASLHYSCIYWGDHLYNWDPSSSADHIVDLQDRGVLDCFFREKFLYWLETLSLCKGMSKGVVLLTKLKAFTQRKEGSPLLIELVQDARRFIMSHKQAIENSPLQTYVSALVFSPAQSLIKGLFKAEEPHWIKIMPITGDEWSPCLQTLEGHSGPVNSLALSHDSAQLASASDDHTIKLWDTNSGECLQTLKGHSNQLSSVAFSHDSAWLASSSIDSTVKLWDVSSGECFQTLKGHSGWVNSVAFSHTSAWLASASQDSTIRIWNVSGECLHILKGHSGPVNSLALSHDSAQLASASYDDTVKLWDANSGECLQTLRDHGPWVTSIAFSHNSAWLASASNDGTVKLWDANSGECLRILSGHSAWVVSVAFSHNSAWLASASNDSTIKVWDPSSGKCLQTHRGHGGSVTSVAFSHDSSRLASVSHDGTIKVWDPSSGECLQILKGYLSWVKLVAFSHDSSLLASASHNGTIKIWDPSSGKCLQTLNGHYNSLTSVAFSHNSAWLASASQDSIVKIWDASSSECLQTLEGHGGCVNSVAFSYNSSLLASASNDGTIKVWDPSSGKCLQTLNGHYNPLTSVAFSHDSAWLASASNDGTVKLWDASSGECLQTLKGHIDTICLVAFSHNSVLLATASCNGTVNVWAVSSGDCLQTLEGHCPSITSAAFSHDLARIALTSNDRTVKILDLNSGECLQTLGFSNEFFNTLFSAVGEHRQAGTSDFVVSSTGAISASATGESITDLQRPQHKGVALSLDRTWITYNSENLLWLPPEYRPSCSVASGQSISIGVGSGKVWTCKIELHTS